MGYYRAWVCDNCGDTGEEGYDEVETDMDTVLCDTCYSEDYGFCAVCENEIYYPNGEYSSCEETTCYGCAPEYHEQAKKDYPDTFTLGECDECGWEIEMADAPFLGDWLK